MDRKKYFCWGAVLVVCFGANRSATASGTFSLSGSNPPIIVHADFTDPSKSAGDLPATLSTTSAMHQPPAPSASYWKLNGSGDNAVSGGPALQLMGGLSFNTSATGFDLGKFHDGAVFLNGSSHYLKANGTDSHLAFGTGNFAVGLWYLSPAKVFGKQVLVSKGNISGGGPGFELFIERVPLPPDDSIQQMGARIAVSNTAGGTVDATASCVFPKTLSQGAWNHLLLVVDRSSANPTLRIYLNGDLVTSSPGAMPAISETSASTLPSGHTVDNSDDLIIGASMGPDGIQNRFKGYVDDMKLFNTALTNKQANLACRTPQSLYAGDYACSWLQDYIERLTGTKPEIYSESHTTASNYSGPIISVGHTVMAAGISPLAKQAIVKVTGSGDTARVFVIGHDVFGPREDDPDWNPLDPDSSMTDGWFSGNKGTCTAASLLLKQFGVKWFIPGTKGMKVPAQNPTAVYTATDETYTAPYDYIIGIKHPVDDIYRYANGLTESKKVKSYWSHTWARWVPASDYAPPAHSGVMFDGYNPVAPSGHLCTTSEEAKTVIKNAIQARFNAGYDYVELGQTDGWRACKCPGCTAAFDADSTVSVTVDGVAHAVNNVKDFDQIIYDEDNESFSVIDYNIDSRWPSGAVVDPNDPDGSVYDRFKWNPSRRIHTFHRDIVQSIDPTYFSGGNNRKILLSGYQIAWAPPLANGSYPADRIVVQHTRRPYYEGVGLWDGKASGVGLYGYYWGNWKSSGSLPKSSPKILLEDFQLMASTSTGGVKGMQYNGASDDWPLEGPVYYIANCLAQESNPAAWTGATLSEKVREYCDFAYGNTTSGAAMAAFFEKLYSCVDATYVQAWKPENKNAEWFFSTTFTPADIAELDLLINTASSAITDPKENMMLATKLNYGLLRSIVLMFHAKHAYENAAEQTPLASQLLPKLDAWEAAVEDYHAARSALMAVTNTTSTASGVYKDYQQEWYRGSGMAYSYLDKPHPNAAITPPSSAEFSDARADAELLTSVSLWAFDADLEDSWENNQLTLKGTPLDVGETYAFDGSLGWAKAFDGVDDYLESGPAPVGMDFGTHDFFIGGWVNFVDASSPVDQTILMAGDGENSLKFYRAANNTPRVDITINGTTYTCETVPSATFQSGVYQHVCFTMDRSGSVPVASLYLDGDKVNTTASATPLPNNSISISPALSPFFIGAAKDSAGNAKDFLKGEIDGLRIEEAALSGEEVEELVSGDVVPLSRWAFDNDALDEFGGNHGTLSGTTSYGGDGLGGGAVILNGTNSKVTVTAGAPPVNAPELSSLGTGDFTVTLRFKSNAAPSFPTVDYRFLFMMGGTQSFDIRIWNKTLTTADVRATTSLAIPTATPQTSKTSNIIENVPITIGQWYNLAVVVNRSGSGSFTVYCGEVAKLPKTIGNNVYGGTTMSFQTQPLVIGGQASSNSLFNGEIDDVRIYPRALTKEEVAGIPFPSP